MRKWDEKQSVRTSNVFGQIVKPFMVRGILTKGLEILSWEGLKRSIQNLVCVVACVL